MSMPRQVGRRTKVGDLHARAGPVSAFELAERRVEQPVEHPPFLDGRLAQPALELIARPLEHATGPRVGLEDVGVEAAEIEAVEGVVGELSYRGRRDATVPVRLAEPVADLLRVAPDILLQEHADAARSLAV